ncbi:hypothetical protein ACOZ38_33560 [Sphaerisporangium viridialbum]|uniref:hypothetical protein n=1 Tax=Sphaerisporangium viridialbum TaxID=46189 RepID=UPI003C76FF77
MSEKREFATSEGMDFLNSFIARDLDRFSEAVRLGRYGTALDAYMRTSEPGRTGEQGLLEVLRAWEITAGEGCADGSTMLRISRPDQPTAEF